jgi:serine/threonine-protein kinase HipA
MSDVEIQLGGLPLGAVYRHPAAGGERISFRYASEWLANSECFAIDPELFLDARVTTPARGGLFGAFTDCAPDRWGRQLPSQRECQRMQSAFL